MLRRMRTIVRLTKRFLHDRDGAVAVIVVLLLPVILGFAALTVDGSYLYWTKTQLQATADASALAGMATLPPFKTTLTDAEKTAIVSSAQTFAGRNMASSQHGTVLATADVVPGHWDANGTFGTARTFYALANLPSGAVLNAVTAVTRRAAANNNAAPLFFARLLGFTSLDVTASAVAVAAPGPDDVCILSLDPTSNAGAIEMSGTNNLDIPTCGMALHSTSSKALKLAGTNDIEAKFICVKDADGVDNSGTTTFSPGGVDPTKTLCTPPPDPLADLPEPPVANTCTPANTNYVLSGSSQTVTLSPGTYCGGITISGSSNTVTFGTGKYVLKGGGFKISGGSNTITGNDVMFFNTDDTGSSDGSGSFGDIDFSGSGSTVSFSAPATGIYAGVLFYQDHQASAGDFLFKIAGSISANLNGLIYMPDQLVEFSGNSTLGLACGPKIIAFRIKFNGNSGDFGGGDTCRSSLIPITLTPRFRLVL